MSENATLARPYAKAIFELAQSQNALPAWSEVLSALKTIVAHEDFSVLLGNPKVTDEQLSGLLGDLLKSEGAAANLTRLLVENERLSLAAEIAEQYEAMRARAESRVDVEVTAAAEMSQVQVDAFSAALKKRLGLDVSVETAVDKDLIGGAIVRAGDLVIDGSVRSELTRMGQSLAQ